MDQTPISIGVDEDIIDLIPTYIANRWTDIASAESAVREGDMEALRFMGHSMKGSGGSHGLDEVTTVGEGLESAALAGDGAGVLAWIERLRVFLQRVEVFPIHVD